MKESLVYTIMQTESKPVNDGLELKKENTDLQGKLGVRDNLLPNPFVYTSKVCSKSSCIQKSKYIKKNRQSVKKKHLNFHKYATLLCLFPKVNTCSQFIINHMVNIKQKFWKKHFYQCCRKFSRKTFVKIQDYSRILYGSFPNV